LDVAELRAAEAQGNAATPFHSLLAASGASPAAEVLVNVPTWRGYRFLAFLEWLVCARLAEPSGSKVTWRALRKGGATGMERILAARGWDFTKSRDGSVVEFLGCAPSPGPCPEPASFEAELRGRRLHFSADWGVFSGEHVDDGTLLLFQVAAEHGPVDLVVDVGAGYGPLAVGLAATGVAKRAVATEIDSVALALTGRNADSAGVSVELLLHDDPTQAPVSDLTVCAFPTHLERASSNRLLRAVCDRARSGGVVLIDIHASLEGRFVGRFEAEGATASVVGRTTHSVLSVTMDAGSRPRPSPLEQP
jgi:16S rRNA G1207 methylase RsmC